MRFKEIPRPKLPETFPRELFAVAPGVPAQWFGELEASEWATDDTYVYRVGNGYAPPFVLFVLTIPRPRLELEEEEGSELRWPSFPELWDIGEELTLEGAILSYPVQLVGMAPPDFGRGTYVIVTQTGAVGGTEAGRKLELAGGVPMALPQRGPRA